MGKANPIKIIKDVVKTVVNVFKSIIKFVGDIVGFVFNPMGAFDTPTGPTNPEQEAQGVTITKAGTNQPIPVVYGFRRVGGNLTFVETNGTSNKYLYAVFALCEGEIEGIHKILVEDVELPYPSGATYTPGQVYTVTEGRFANRIQFQVFNGTEDQGQSSLANETPTWPTKSRKLPGVAYVVFRFEWKEIKTQDDANNNPFGGGIPKVQFDVFGKKVYDVRTHASGLTLANDYANLTKRYSFNPANCLLDYMMNPRFGCGLQKEEIDAESFKIAANKYEQTVTYYTGTTGRAMTLNYVVNTGAKLYDNVKALIGGCRGIMPYVQGRYKLKVEDSGNATDITSTAINIAYDVDKDNVIGGITLQGERKDTKFNEVIVNYVDPDLNFSNQQVYYSVAGDQAADDNELLRQEFTFATVTNKAIAQDLAKLIYLKSRSQKSISFSGTQELLQVEVGDIIRVTDTVLGLNLDTFRVVDIKLNLDLTVDIAAVEHDATIYPFTSTDQIEIPPPLFLPDELAVRPRVKNVSTPLTGIIPPIDPDEDSAGAPVIVVPPPPIVDIPLTYFTDFRKSPLSDIPINQTYFDKNYPTDSDGKTIYRFTRDIYWSYYVIDEQGKQGLAKPAKFWPDHATHSTSTLNGQTSIRYNSRQKDDYVIGRPEIDKFQKSYYGSGAIFFDVLLNAPADVNVEYALIKLYANDGSYMGEYQTGPVGLAGLNLLTVKNYLDGDPYPIRGRSVNTIVAPSKVARSVEFRWTKSFGGKTTEIGDGSVLDNGPFTYYNAQLKKNVTDSSIQAYINSRLQNVELTLMQVASGPNSASGSSVSSNHNLGA